MIKYPTLYTRDSNGGIRFWYAEVEGHRFRQNFGVLNGKTVTTEWSHAEPKNTGKKNATTAEEQAIKETEALIKKQKKSNYFEKIEDVDKGFLEPQLAKPNKNYIDKVRWEDGQILDDKLNGIACIITKKGAFTRTNEQFFAIPHILEDLAPLFEAYPDAYVQGELFNPAYVNELNKIAELVAVTRKEKDMTPELLAESKRMVQYHIYDGYNFMGIAMEDEGLKRRILLQEMFDSNTFNLQYCKMIRWERVYSFEQMVERAEEYIGKGGEGKIIRNPKAPYQHKRTKDLLKWKKSESEEFKILYFEEGDADWKGCAKAVWLDLPEGKKDNKFKSNIRGERPLLRKVWEEQQKYIGKYVTVDFQEYSPYNVPLIPFTSLINREEVEGLKKD